ncbi:MAG: hypothetical protein R3B38_02315 [Patescibacteria group bacterium]
MSNDIPAMIIFCHSSDNLHSFVEKLYSQGDNLVRFVKPVGHEVGHEVLEAVSQTPPATNLLVITNGQGVAHDLSRKIQETRIQSASKVVNGGQFGYTLTMMFTQRTPLAFQRSYDLVMRNGGTDDIHALVALMSRPLPLTIAYHEWAKTNGVEILNPVIDCLG